MDESAVVEPKSAAPTPEATVEPADGAAPAESQASGIPDEVLAIPAMQAVLAGSPAAVSAPIAEFSKRPEAALIVQHKDALVKAGFGLYRSLAGNLGVIFNLMKLHPEQLLAADKAGKLLDVAPSFDAVNHAVSSSGANHPVLNASNPTGPASAPMPEVPQSSASVQPESAGVAKKIATARLNNAQPGSPTSGPTPGQGRLLSAIMKPVL